MNKSREREGDKATALCWHKGRNFSSDRAAIAVNCLKSSSTLLDHKISDGRTEGVGGRSGMGTPAVVCFTTPHSYSKNYAGENVPGMIE